MSVAEMRNSGSLVCAVPGGGGRSLEVPLSDITAGKESEFLQQLAQHSTAEAANRHNIYHMHSPILHLFSITSLTPVILSSNMSAEQAAASIPEESKEVELGPLPSVEGKSEDEVKELLGKAAKQGMFAE